MNQRISILKNLSMTFVPFIFLIILIIVSFGKSRNGFAGSTSCKKCHQKFYDLWEPSHHGKAMQPFTKEFAENHLTFPSKTIKIDRKNYHAILKGKSGWVVEEDSIGKSTYEILHVLGGKNIFYFLTPLEKGKLQVLPLGYNVTEKEWYNINASMVRHFTDIEDEALNWRNAAFTFNTSCYSCHVSQMSSNFDLSTNTYHTTWNEPGISCETCHGPSKDHNKVSKWLRIKNWLGMGDSLDDYKIISVKKFNSSQLNSSCAPCHAKMRPITNSFTPGDDYFDHYDLTTLEDRDFYPDARDLGENYSYTLWRMSPCVKSGKLSCTHCHTSSGRWKFKGEESNSCKECHGERVANIATHSHHDQSKKGVPSCISCHMPMTEFALMKRSDHSMLPPTPATTVAYGSPNSCNICHTDQTAQWADKQAREWFGENYQDEKMYLADLLVTCRKQDWSKLPEVLNYIQNKNHDEIYTTSFIRLLYRCQDPSKWPALLSALGNKSPLVRSVAAEQFENNLSETHIKALAKLLDDDSRLARIKTASTLSRINPAILPKKDQKKLQSALMEYKASLQVQLDTWSSHYNLGNFYANQQNIPKALDSYGLASQMDSTVIMPYVNSALLHNMMGENDKAEANLRKAAEYDNGNFVVQFNLALLLVEKGKLKDAETAFRAALKTNPESVQVAYNLAVLISKDRLKESIKLCRQAAELNQQDPKYLYTLAYYLNQNDQNEEAKQELNKLNKLFPAFGDAYILYTNILVSQNKQGEAIEYYQDVINNNNLPESVNGRLNQQLKLVKTSTKKYKSKLN